MISTSSIYCVDASLVSRIITGAANQEIESLFNTWNQNQTAYVAPGLLGYEIANTLHRKRTQGLTDSMISQAFEFLEGMSIQLVDDAALHLEALELARSFRHPASYDAHYLAVALRFGVELWTCDRRLFNSVRSRFEWVQFANPDS